MADARAPVALWRTVRAMPEFWRLLELRAVSQFGDGLFQAGLAGAILFNPQRAADPWAIAAAFAVLFLPYSVLGPFAGALLDRWDRRLVLIGANSGRFVLVVGVAGLLCLYGLVLWRIFNLAGRAAEAKAYFGARLAQGIGLLLIVQVMFHFAVNLGLVPTKGLNLPLMSYGGSSMLINGLAFGLLISIEHSLSKGRVGAR